MKLRNVILLALCLLPSLTATAQTEVTDSLLPDIEFRELPAMTDKPEYMKTPVTMSPVISRINDVENYKYHRIQPLHISMPADGRIAMWYNGGVFGAIAVNEMPGMMGIESGSITLVQQLGRFTFTTHADAVKYGYFNGLTTSYGIGGSLSYRINDRLSVTMFGNYYTPTGNVNPAMAGYISLPSFGGYVDYRFSERWGVKVGAQSYRTSDTGRWHTQPMVIPYYRLSEKAEIGVDVGGILYNIIRSSRGKSFQNMGNPTIPPPVGGPPPVAPRR